MNAATLAWKRARWNDLPTLWDGDATWCLQMGPLSAAGGKARQCRMSFWPPQTRPETSITFDLNIEDEELAKDVLGQLAVTAEHALAGMIGLALLEEVGIVSGRFMQDDRPFLGNVLVVNGASL